MTVHINMQIQNGDLNLNYLKINAISSSAVVILGDAETIKAESTATSVGRREPLLAPVTTPGGAR